MPLNASSHRGSSSRSDVSTERPAPGSMSAAAPFVAWRKDPAAGLRAIVGPSEAAELVDLFLEEGRVAMTAIEYAFVCGDAEAMARSGSDLRGLTSMMGAPWIAESCAQLLRSESEAVGPRVVDLWAAWACFERVLVAWTTAERQARRARPRLAA